LVSSEKNFQFYRDNLHSVTIKEPVLPYSAMYLKDITFIEDGNKDYVEDSKINVSKMSMLASYLVLIINYQKIKFPFKKDANLQSQLMYNVVILSEEEQYEMSKRMQGRSSRDEANVIDLSRPKNCGDSLRVPQINKRSSLPTYLGAGPVESLAPVQRSADDRISF
jgi:hypothetical protein